MTKLCKCFFCGQNRPHPDNRHDRWQTVSHHLIVAESLNPDDSIQMESCWTCGHKRPIPGQSGLADKLRRAGVV